MSLLNITLQWKETAVSEGELIFFGEWYTVATPDHPVLKIIP